MPMAARGGDTTRRRRAPGKINLVTPILILIVAGAVYFGYKFAPPYITDYEFKGFLAIQARNSYNWNDEKIRQHIAEYAQREGIPLKDDGWSVYRADKGNEKEIFIRVRYYQIVDLPFGQDRKILFEHDIRQKIEPLKEL